MRACCLRRCAVRYHDCSLNDHCLATFDELLEKEAKFAADLLTLRDLWERFPVTLDLHVRHVCRPFLLCLKHGDCGERCTNVTHALRGRVNCLRQLYTSVTGTCPRNKDELSKLYNLMCVRASVDARELFLRGAAP